MCGGCDVVCVIESRREGFSSARRARRVSSRICWCVLMFWMLDLVVFGKDDDDVDGFYEEVLCEGGVGDVVCEENGE